MMSDAGLFDPIINFLIKRAGKNVATIFIAIVLTTFVAHLDGSGATTFLIVVPAFLPICKRMGVRPQALLGAMCGAYGVMNLVPWGGPTMRAASVVGVEAGDLYGFMIPGVVCLAIAAFGIAIGLIVNFPNAKQQNKKIKEYGTNAMVMTMTLFSVGIFMGVIKDSGMVEAMANAIVAVLPSAIAPHMHWFMCLFSVPLLMILGTDAFYYALLPIIIGVVEPFGVAQETVAAAFLLTATMGTPVSPSVAATYVGLGLADVSIGEHIKYSLRLVWPASIAVLIMATVIGVIKF